MLRTRRYIELLRVCHLFVFDDSLNSLLCFISVLHPRHKLAYFMSAVWKEKWIKTAEKLVRDRFKCDYPGLKTEDTDGSDSEDPGRQVCHLVLQIRPFFHSSRAL